MQVRHITAAEKIQLSMVQSIAFLFPYDIEAAKKRAAEKPEEIHAEDCWACFDDEGILISGMENTPFSIYYDGHTVGMGGIGGVASLPEGRMRGGIRAIFEKVFQEDREKGRLFSVLYPFSAEYYRKFGYEVCNVGRVVRFPIEQLRPFKLADDVRMYRPEEGTAALSAIHERFASRYNYAVSRGARAWKNVLHCDPFKAEGYPYILSSGGEERAYCIFKARRESDETITMIMQDYAFVDHQALLSLFGFLFKLSAQFAHIEMELPEGLELAAMFANPYDIKDVRGSVTMARALDVGEALRLMRHPQGSGAYALAVEDAFLPENTGVYRVRYENGDVQVQKEMDGAADARMSIHTLTQLCLGYMPFEMALYRPEVRLSGNEETLRSVFVHKPKLLFDRF